MAAVRGAIVFLDWDTARRITPKPRIPAKDARRAAREIEPVFDALRQVVADHLTTLDPRTIFRVRWRLYHGWFAGKTRTPDHDAVRIFKEDTSTSVIGKISFGADVEIATSLLSGGRRMPLYDTLRDAADDDGREARQKMVDTGLVCDLLHSSRSARDDVHLVYGDDDDLLPGVFMAEAWGARVHMLRPEAGSRFLNTRDVVTVVPRPAA